MYPSRQSLQFAYGQSAEQPGRFLEYTNTNDVILGHKLAQLDGSLKRSPSNLDESYGLGPVINEDTHGQRAGHRLDADFHDQRQDEFLALSAWRAG